MTIRYRKWSKLLQKLLYWRNWTRHLHVYSVHKTIIYQSQEKVNLWLLSSEWNLLISVLTYCLLSFLLHHARPDCLSSEQIHANTSCQYLPSINIYDSFTLLKFGVCWSFSNLYDSIRFSPAVLIIWMSCKQCQNYPISLQFSMIAWRDKRCLIMITFL